MAECRKRGPRPSLDPALAVLLSTSGTTGSPKLVRLSAANIDANAASIADYLAITPDDRAITSLPCHYSYGLSVLNSHLLAGAGIILTDASVSTPEFRATFETHRATSMAGVPYVYELLESSGFRERPHPHLRTLTQAGGRLAPALVAAYTTWAAANDVRFFVMYGQTEATARMAYLPLERARDASDCIGIAIPGGHFDLADIDNPTHAVIAGAGELVYTGPNVMMGYAETPADLALAAGPNRLYTGDIAERTAHGLYRIVGRKSRFAKPFGLRIGLDDVETLLNNDGIEAAVTGDDSLIAVVYTGSGTADDVAARLAAGFALPASLFDVRFVPALPRLSTGKIDYRVILEEASARRGAILPDDHAGFLNLYRDLLGRPNATSADSFVDLSGDSLSYVNVAMAIDRRLGHLPVDWQELSIDQLDTLIGMPAGPHGIRSGWRGIDSEIVLRALAIIAVVITHASDIVVGGGASVLLLLVGYNLARFQRARIERGAVWQMVGSMLGRIILPYYVILLTYIAVKREVDIPALLLVGNFSGHFGSLIEPYWFIEALLQVTVIAAALFSLPPVRRLAINQPWRFGLALLGGSLAVKVAAAGFMPHPGLAERTPDAVFFIVALGWCVYIARRPVQRVTVFLIAVILAMFELIGTLVSPWWPTLRWPAAISHDLWLVGAIAALLWLPRLTVPGWFQATAAAVAGASFYIYLVHVVPVHVLHTILHFEILPVTVLVSIILGMLARRCIDSLKQFVLGHPWVRYGDTRGFE